MEGIPGVDEARMKVCGTTWCSWMQG